MLENNLTSPLKGEHKGNFENDLTKFDPRGTFVETAITADEVERAVEENILDAEHDPCIFMRDVNK